MIQLFLAHHPHLRILSLDFPPLICNILLELLPQPLVRVSLHVQLLFLLGQPFVLQFLVLNTALPDLLCHLNRVVGL